MGADKKSSLKRELGLCPKFTTKDSHTSLRRSHSHNGPSNPRNKPQTIPKWKHNSRSKGLNCHVKAQVDGLRGWGGRSASTRRMVRDPRADSPKNATEPPVSHLEKRTVRALSPDGLRATAATRTVCGLQADSPACTRTVRYPYADGPTNHLHQNYDTPKDLHANSQELDEHGKNMDRTDSPQPTGGRSARHEQNSPSFKPRSQPFLPIPRSPKWLELLRKNLRKMCSVPRGCYAQKLGSSNELDRWKSNHHRTQPKT
jgi:hypothetical protein